MPIWLAEQLFFRLYLQSHAVQYTAVFFSALPLPALLLQLHPFGAKLLQLVSDGLFAFEPSI
jgi:hypothetical protein